MKRGCPDRLVIQKNKIKTLCHTMKSNARQIKISIFQKKEIIEVLEEKR